MADVDWRLISKAVEYYVENGYRYVDVPWTVPGEFTRATCPEDRWIVGSTLGDLVGSAEQSFMYLDSLGQLGQGKFVTCTPCFRNEDETNWIRQKHFMKVELYTNLFDQDDIHVLTKQALEFFNQFSWLNNSKLQLLTFKDGTFDIALNGIEIGSYGVRNYKNLRWMYGTALAEPRFSTALNHTG